MGGLATPRRASLAAIVLAAFALRVLFLTSQSLWRDEVDVLTFALEPIEALASRFTTTGENGPLYYLLMRGWIGVAGTSEFAIRFPAAVFGTIAVALIGTLGVRIAGGRAGTLAAALAATSPFLVWYSQDAKMYGAFLAVSAVGYWLAAQFAARPRWWLAAAWFAIAVIGAYVHLFALLGAVSMLAFAVASSRIELRWSPWWILAIAPLLLLVPVARWAIPVIATPPPSAYEFLQLPDLLAVLAQALSVPASAILTGIVVALALAALAADKRRLVVVALWAAVAIPVAGYFLNSLRYPVFTERYFIFLAVPFFVLVATGWDGLWRRSAPIAGILAVVIVGSFTAASLQQSLAPIKSDFRAAARYVEASFETGDSFVFVMPQVEPTFRYYFGKAGTTVRASVHDEGAPTFSPTLDGGRRVWLILSEPEQWDPRGVIPHALTQRFTVAQSASFTGVGVTLLVEPEDLAPRG